MTARTTALVLSAVPALFGAGSVMAQCPAADLNDDCRVDAADLQLLAGEWPAKPQYADLNDDPDDPGIELLFPTDPPLILAPGEYLVPVKDLAVFGSTYTGSANVTVLACNEGNLSNGAEKIQLSKPGDEGAEGERPWIRADRVVYSDGTCHGDFPDGHDPWPLSADGGGLALGRMDPDAYGNDPGNWQDAMPTPGGPNRLRDAQQGK